MRAESLPVDDPSRLTGSPRSAWLAILGVSLGAALLAALVSLVIPKTYRAESRILPNFSNGTSQSLLALASGAGLADFLSGQISSENPILTYPEILHSTTVLERTLLAATDSFSTTRVIDALGIEKRSPRESIDAGLRELRAITEVRANPRSGLISVAAVTRDSVLSTVIVKKMLAELDRFNVESRTSRGQAARAFVEKRLAEAKLEMSDAEYALARFREANLRIGNSPQLRLQEDRLQREVLVRSELYQLLTREFEMARIEEKRDTPTFSIIDPARPPVRKYRPKVLLNTLAAFLIAVVIQLVRLYLRRVRTDKPSLVARTLE